MPGDNHAPIVRWSPHHDVASCLVVYLKTGALQRLDHLAGRDRRQSGHYAGSSAMLRRPTNCSVASSTGMGSPCFSRLAQ